MKVRIENGVTIITMEPSVSTTKNKTGYTGVTYYQKTNKYKVTITIDYTTYTLGWYDKPEDAGKLYRIANEHRLNGTFMKWYEEIQKHTYQKRLNIIKL